MHSQVCTVHLLQILATSCVLLVRQRLWAGPAWADWHPQGSAEYQLLKIGAFFSGRSMQLEWHHLHSRESVCR